MRDLLQQFNRIPTPIEGIPEVRVIAPCVGLMITGGALSAEIASASSLMNYYGAGYEIASLVDGKMQKLDNVTYIFWYGNVNDEGTGVNLHHVSKYSYANDILLIRSAKFSGFSEQLTADASTVAVSPIYRDVTREEVESFEVPNFNSKWLCSYYFLKHPAHGEGVFADVHLRGQGEPPIEFNENATHLSFRYKKDRVVRMIKYAKDSLENTSSYFNL